MVEKNSLAGGFRSNFSAHLHCALVVSRQMRDRELLN